MAIRARARDDKGSPDPSSCSPDEPRAPTWPAKRDSAFDFISFLLPTLQRHGESSARYAPLAITLCSRHQLTPCLGTLVKCDPSIKALILTIDRDSGNKYVIEDLGDEEHLLVKNDKVNELKRTVQHVRIPVHDDA